MIKVARKPSNDPAQEKLRQSKALWNKEVSTFVNDLIHYKKLMNGWPNKFFKERSRITDPIPADPATIIGTLAGDFQEIANKGNSLIQEQVNYAKTRRKKQPKQMELPLGKPPEQTAPATPPAAPAPDLSQQLALPLAADAHYNLIKVASTFEDKYGFDKQASNPVSRFFTKLFTPTIGFSQAAQIRRARMAMLTASAKVYKELERFQVQVVKGSDQSIGASYELMKGIWYEWMKVKLGYDSAKEFLPKEVKDSGGPLDAPISKEERKSKEEKPQSTESFEGPDMNEPQEQAEQPVQAPAPDRSTMEVMAIANAIINDYRSVLKGGHFAEDMAQFSSLNNYLGQFKMVPDPALASNIINEYKATVSALNAKYHTNGNTLQEIAASKDKQPKVVTAQLEVVAQDFLKKWLGKLRHSVLTNKTSSLRLNAYKSAKQMRTSINKIMDSLESGLKIEELAPLIADVNSQMTRSRGTLRALHLSGKQEIKDGKRLPPH